MYYQSNESTAWYCLKVFNQFIIINTELIQSYQTYNNKRIEIKDKVTWICFLFTLGLGSLAKDHHLNGRNLLLKALHDDLQLSPPFSLKL